MLRMAGRTDAGRQHRLTARTRCPRRQPGDALPSRALLTAYHIGNSLTYGVASDPRFAAVMGTGSAGYTFGMHIRWGMPLAAILGGNRTTPSVAPAPYGAAPHALSDFSWQVVTSPADLFALLEEPARGRRHEREVPRKLIRQKSPDAQVYIDETWPTIGKDAAVGTFLRRRVVCTGPMPLASATAPCGRMTYCRKAARPLARC